MRERGRAVRVGRMAVVLTLRNLEQDNWATRRQYAWLHQTASGN